MTIVQRPPMRLGKRHEFCVYAIGVLLLLSGLGWLIAHYFFAPLEEFGATAAPSEPWWLRIHGAAAMGGSIVLGSLFPGHVARSWALRQNFSSGMLILSVVILLLTGYGLYYAGDEDTRPWISLVHWILGIAASGVLILHVKLGKRRFRPARPFSVRLHSPDDTLKDNFREAKTQTFVASSEEVPLYGPVRNMSPP
jgi:hypothetical protein